VENAIFKEDALSLLKALPSESIDLLITDPPYESIERYRQMGTPKKLGNSLSKNGKWFSYFPNSDFWEFFEEAYRIMKPGTHLYIFADDITRDLICCGHSPIEGDDVMLYSEGGYTVGHETVIRNDQIEFKYWKSIVWDKMKMGMGYHYRNRHEYIIFLEKVVRKGKHRQLNDRSIPSVIQVPRPSGKGTFPTEKPVELLEILIKNSSEPGDTVLDPFCGSGSTGQAAKNLGRYYILGDIDDKEARSRLE
jgi:site-specific DNA-methyltransferase (adenine-specific)